ncbi:MAG: BUD32 family EKC/KEOPS complex subunit [Planctomycetota bacterium]
MSELSEQQRAALLEGAGLHPRKLGWLPDGTAVLSRHRRRRAARIDLDGPSGTLGVYVKWWAAPTWGALLSGKGWFCPAKDEAKRCRRLRAAGFNAPQVLEVRRTGGILIPGASRLVLAEVAGTPLKHAWPEQPAERRSLARAVGGLVAGLTRAGITTPDLHSGHLFVAGSGEGWALGLVDCARAGDPTGEHEALAALDASRPGAVTRTDRLRVLKAATDATGAALKAVATQVLARSAQLAALFRDRAIGAALPAEVYLDGGRMRATEESLPILLAHAFETGAAFCDPNRGTLVRAKDGYENLEYTLGLPGPKAHWYAKRYHTQPWSAVWRGVLGLAPKGDPAQREWEMARRWVSRSRSRSPWV